MKKTLGLALVGGLLALGLGQSYGQSNTVSLQTLNIALTGFSGGGSNGTSAATEKINNQRIISSLVGSNSTKSKLQFTVDSGGSVSVFVTTGSGKNVTAVDVSSFFSFGSSTDTLIKGKTGYTIDTFSFGGGTDTNGVSLTPISFTVQGFTTSQSSGAFNSQVNGSGTDNGNLTVLKGTISATPPSKSVTISITGGGGGGGTNTTASVSP
jgi:hypothetical protein